MSKDKASDISSQMRDTAKQEKPIQAGKSDKRRVKELPSDPSQRVRVSLDLAKTQHKFLKMFAVEAETDASAVLRALLTRLETDEELAEAVRAKLSG